MSALGRPSFIPQEVFREWITPRTATRYCRVDGIRCSGYIGRWIRLERPIPSRIVYGQTRYRLLDIVARARAETHVIEPVMASQVERSIEDLRAERAALASEIEAERHRLAMSVSSLALTGATLLTEAEIAAGRFAFPHDSGVYFLLDGEKVVYVGQSTCIGRRIGDHVADKTFDGIAFIACSRLALNAMESLYIHYLRPKYNGRWRDEQGMGMQAPLRLDDLLGRVRS